jgi:hypothetical protein
VAKAAIGEKVSKSATPKNLAEMTLNQLSGGLHAAVTTKLVKVQLHWSEHVHGEWSVRQSGGYDASLVQQVPLYFDNSKVFIHATRTFDDENGDELGVKIHLGGDIKQAFHVVSRNSRPTKANREAPPPMPYNAPKVQANRYGGEGAFKVTFVQRIETENSDKPKITPVTPDILQQGGKFTLLPCANAITLGTAEIASLVTPLFYQDDRANSFFIEPTFKETTVEEWTDWVAPTRVPEVEWDKSDWWDKLHVMPMQPKTRIPVPVNPGDPIWQIRIDPRARFALTSQEDWLANPATVMDFGGELVGPAGHAGLAVKSALEASIEGTAATAVTVNAGSALAPGNSVVTVDSIALAGSGLGGATGGLNVVGGSGLNSALLKNVNTLKRS